MADIFDGFDNSFTAHRYRVLHAEIRTGQAQGWCYSELDEALYQAVWVLFSGVPAVHILDTSSGVTLTVRHGDEPLVRLLVGLTARGDGRSLGYDPSLSD